MDTFSKTVVMGHPVHMEVFNTDDTKSINDLTAILMGEVLPFELNSFVYSRFVLPHFEELGNGRSSTRDVVLSASHM